MTIKNAIMISLCTQRCYGRHNVSRKSIFTSCLSILLHGVISLPDETSDDKRKSLFKIRMNAFDNYVKKKVFQDSIQNCATPDDEWSQKLTLSLLKHEKLP